MSTQTFIETLALVHCGGCGLSFGLTTAFRDTRLADHKQFNCPNGCYVNWSGKSESELLKEELAAKEAQLTSARSNRDYYQEKYHATEKKLDYKGRVLTRKTNELHKVKTRIRHGVCPCCNRSFADLHKHMNSKHPGFSKSEEIPA